MNQSTPNGLSQAPSSGSVPPPAPGGLSQAPMSGSVPPPAPGGISQAPSSGSVRQVVPTPKKRRWGCCSGRLLLVLAAVVGAVLVWNWWFSRDSGVLTLGKRVKVAAEAITLSGDVLAVDEPGSPIDGLRIAVPAGAYDTRPDVAISTRSIEDHALGDDFNPVTPLIHVDNGGAFAAEAMTVTVPIQISDDQFAMGFFYDQRTGRLEGMPLVDLTTDSVTLLTSHFSDFLISTISLADLADTDVDTGFEPGIDDWQFVNQGSYIAQGGHCAGQSMTAMWYYFEQYLGAGERRLYGRYDNNNYGVGTIDFQEDDSWGYRWASVAQRSQWDKGVAVYRLWGLTSDSLTWHSFAYAMRLTGEPQYVSIGRYVEVDGKPKRRGHALVAYKMAGNRLYVADPNYPGKADRFISYENGVLQPYASGANARDIAANGVRSYTEIHYLAKTALVDWAKLGSQYAELKEGEAGKGFFPNYNFMYLAEFNPTTNHTVWLPLPEVLELDEEALGKVQVDAYRGKLLVAVNMTPLACKVSRYEGTGLLEVKSSDGSHDVQFLLPLTKGISDLGFLIENMKDGAAYYSDFRRVKLIYELPDLSGTWQGTWRVDEAVNARRYVEDGLAWVLLKTTLADNETEAHEIAAAAIEENPNLYDERPMSVDLTALDPDKLDRYTAEVHLQGEDGSTTTYLGEATLSEGILTLNTEAGEDGSRFHFSAKLAGSDNLSGEFSVTAWRVLKNALSGRWQVVRQE